MEDRSLLSEETISNKIYYIRNQKVMLDSDLALLYEVETKRLNEQVKGTHQKYLPFAFTEHGTMMLSSVLKSDKAIQTNIQIMRIFTKVRQMLFDTTEISIDILHPEASGLRNLKIMIKTSNLYFPIWMS